MTNQKTALITGIHGQDGFYLSRLLLKKDYRVIGLGRGAVGPGWPHASRIDYRSTDLHDVAHLIRLLKELSPSEVYNLAAQSFVPLSWEQPIGTFEANGLPVISLLEAIRATDPEIRFFQASSAHMFGEHCEQPCSEQTLFRPRNPYAVSKLFAHMMTVNYREAHGVFAVSGILFNHESPHRAPHFLTKKVSRAVSRIKRGLQSAVDLGDLSAQRDWGFAGDFVRGMWLSLQADVPSDYVFGTGALHSVEDFVCTAFELAGLDWKRYVRYDPELARDLDRKTVCADATRAEKTLGWRPRVQFRELIERMIRFDLDTLHREG